LLLLLLLLVVLGDIWALIGVRGRGSRLQHGDGSRRLGKRLHYLRHLIKGRVGAEAVELMNIVEKGDVVCTGRNRVSKTYSIGSIAFWKCNTW